MSVEDMEREFSELAEKFWFSKMNLHDEIKKIRLKYPKEVRKEFCKRNPPDPRMQKVVAAALTALEATQESHQVEVHGGKVETVEDPKLKAVLSQQVRNTTKGEKENV